MKEYLNRHLYLFFFSLLVVWTPLQAQKSVTNMNFLVEFGPCDVTDPSDCDVNGAAQTGFQTIKIGKGKSSTRVVPGGNDLTLHFSGRVAPELLQCTADGIPLPDQILFEEGEWEVFFCAECDPLRISFQSHYRLPGDRDHVYGFLLSGHDDGVDCAAPPSGFGEPCTVQFDRFNHRRFDKRGKKKQCSTGNVFPGSLITSSIIPTPMSVTRLN